LFFSQKGKPMYNNLLLIFLLLSPFFGKPVFSQNKTGVLDQYIQQALDTNHGLKEQQFLLEKNLLALEEAKKLYLPEVNFGVSYTVAAGGRNISFPVGDLLNPVYSTLNQITMTNSFPQIENEEVQFLPHNFYDARFRITQPLINREIYFNKKIKREMVGLKEVEIQVFKRELVKEVKTAYYQYLQATEAISIFDNALGLLAENKRVNESLLRNDKVIPSVLLRIESEITNVKAQKNEALTNQQNAAAYFNFLQNRDLEAPIETDELVLAELIAEQTAMQMGNREELQQLQTAQAINALVVELENAYKVPQVGVQVDVGSQNFDFKYGGYVLAGLAVEVPIFAGNRNKLQVQQAQLDLKATAEKIAQVETQIELQTATARNSMLAAIETWRSYQAQLTNARRQYDDTFRRYKEGVSNYIEVLDARTQVTNVELQQSLSMYTVLLKQAELERAVAGFDLSGN
ncbi:MAG: TolC family protein, partial [Saprospiraceae bacterium]